VRHDEEAVMRHDYIHEVSVALRRLELASPDWDNAAELLRGAGRPIVLTGLGKSGLVAARAAATWTSLGMSAVFVHPVDALHGDMRIAPTHGVLVAVSWSGTTAEVVQVGAHAMAQGMSVVAVVGPLEPAIPADAVIHLPDVREPLPPAPMVASLLQEAALDMVACAVIGQDHDPEQFVRWHPGGTIGGQR
jgi:arabinose-5-phosphate isomerase